jgi:hypothetical protein
VAVIECGPLDLVLVEAKLGNALGDPVEQHEPILVPLIHRGPDSGGDVGGDLANRRLLLRY